MTLSPGFQKLLVLSSETIFNGIDNYWCRCLPVVPRGGDQGPCVHITQADNRALVMASELRYVSISLHLVSGHVSDVLVHIPDVHPLKSGVTLSGAVSKERNVDSEGGCFHPIHTRPILGDNSHPLYHHPNDTHEGKLSTARHEHE